MRTRAAIVSVLVLTAGATAGAAGDLTVDAVTRATELNPSVGSLTALTDGRVPETDPAPQRCPPALWLWRLPRGRS